MSARPTPEGLPLGRLLARRRGWLIAGLALILLSLFAGVALLALSGWFITASATPGSTHSAASRAASRVSRKADTPGPMTPRNRWSSVSTSAVRRFSVSPRCSPRSCTSSSRSRRWNSARRRSARRRNVASCVTSRSP